MDVIFALDGSVNVRSKDFEKMKDFVKYSAREYNISAHETHLGVIEYSDRPVLKIKLSDHRDVESFISSLNNIQQSSGRSAVTDEVLRMAASEAFKSFSGGRPTAQRRLIIITGSKSAGSEPVQEAVIPVIREDIQVYVIGVGPRINRKEIMEIVAPNDDRKYILDAHQLETLVKPIKMKILNEAQQGYNLKSFCHNCTPTCDVNDYLFLLLAMNNTKLDIVFVLGARNPFASRDFDVMKKIAQEMIKQPRPSGTLYGFVTYSDRGITRLTPDIPKEILMKLLDLIPWQNEGTRVDKGVEKGIEVIREGNRPGAKKLLIVFMNDKTTASSDNLMNVRRMAEESGVDVIVIGLGSRVSPEQMVQLVTDVDDIILANINGEVDSAVKKIADKVAETSRKGMYCFFEGNIFILF